MRRPSLGVAYCNEQVMKMIDQQSMELDPAKRLAQVIAAEKLGRMQNVWRERS